MNNEKEVLNVIANMKQELDSAVVNMGPDGKVLIGAITALTISKVLEILLKESELKNGG